MIFNVTTLFHINRLKIVKGQPWHHWGRGSFCRAVSDIGCYVGKDTYEIPSPTGDGCGDGKSKVALFMQCPI